MDKKPSPFPNPTLAHLQKFFAGNDFSLDTSIEIKHLFCLERRKKILLLSYPSYKGKIFQQKSIKKSFY